MGRWSKRRWRHAEGLHFSLFSPHKQEKPDHKQVWERACESGIGGVLANPSPLIAADANQAGPDRQDRSCCVCPVFARCDSADAATLTFHDATSDDGANTSANETLTWLDSQGWRAIIPPKKTACRWVCVAEVCVCEAREKDSKSARLCHHLLQWD
ncbi:hypothetical protein PAMP_005686 [Pampus punctatissimus]